MHAEVAGLCQYAAEDVELPEVFIRQRLPGSNFEARSTALWQTRRDNIFWRVSTCPRKQE